MTNAYRLNMWASMLSRTGVDPVSNVYPIGDVLSASWSASANTAPSSARREVLAIVDMQTLGWGDDALRSVQEIPICWERVKVLPTPAFRTAGHLITAWSLHMIELLPSAIAGPVMAKLRALLVPLPAFAYRVPTNCG
jgi:hypothetical protein